MIIIADKFHRWGQKRGATLRHWHIVAAIGIIGGVSLCTGDASAGLRTSTERVLDKASRNLCKGLKLPCRPKSGKATPSQVRAPAAQTAAKPRPKPPINAKATPRKPEAVTQVPARQKPPLPEAKPHNVRNTGTSAPALPVPRKKPVTAEKQIPAVEPAPKQDQARPEAPKPEATKPEIAKPPEMQPPPPVVAPPAQANAGADCRSRLTTLGASFDAAVNAVGDGQCSVTNPVKLTAVKLSTSQIAFPDKPILNCEFAVKFMEWMKEAGAPIVQAQANSPIAQLWTGPGYQCRGRNGNAEAKTSEHGFGNAVDITNFKLADGRMFEVQSARNPRSPAYATLKGLRGSACGYFTTVLGPGSDVAHETHFHFDLGKHGASENYKICE